MTTTTVETRSNVDWHEKSPRELNRTLTLSFGLHIGAVVLLFVLPRSWFSTTTAEPKRMTISLAGSSGQKTSGTTPISTRAIEKEAPPPPRPQPQRPVESKPDPNAAAMTKTPPPPTKPAETTKPAPADTRPPVTGQQVTQGTARVDTGVQTLGNGLTIPGGQGTGGETNLSDFCAPEYIGLMSTEIKSHWDRSAGAGGVTTIRFTIEKDGKITGTEVTAGSGQGLLDRAAQRALAMSTLPPLPACYTNPKLIIRLAFEHGAK